jgi:hypothetical protein
MLKFPTLSRPDWNLPGVLRKAIKNALTQRFREMEGKLILGERG